MEPAERSITDKIVVFVAEGLGLGRIPFAPGTFGTALGFGWIYLLLLPRNMTIYLAGIVLGFFAAVWIGHQAEKILQKTDPSSIVLDEITAMPLAFLPVVLFSQSDGLTEPAAAFFSGKALLFPILTFFLFRFFDIVKPLGIARVQKAPGGWGLVLDDYLAALACAVLLFAYKKIAG